MKPSTPLLLLVLLGGCNPVPHYAAPAPAGALDCAVRVAEDLGYVRTSPADEPAVRMHQPLETPREQERLDPVTGQPVVVVSNVHRIPNENEISIRERRGQLRIDILSRGDGRQLRAEGSDATAHAQILLARCTAP